jgi:hypothetical protein
MANYRLDVYDLSGVQQAVLTDFTALAYVRQVNAPGLVQISLRGNHPILATIGDKWQVEVWRKATTTWQREITGLWRAEQWSYGSERGNVLSAALPGIMSMLSWRHILYPASTSNRTKFVSAKAETVLKTLVNYNAGSAATVVNGRYRAGAITGLSVEADGANGNTVDWYCAYDNLLESLQKLMDIAGGDFDLVKTSATTYELRWYTGQLGTDRSATVTFGLEYGNMANPVFLDSRAGEATVAIVGGQGEEAAREYVIRTGTNYAAGNDIEMFVPATDVEVGDTAGLNSRGDQKLSEVEAVRAFAFDVLQTPETTYGVNYDLGDKVSAINPHNGTVHTQKVRAVSVAIDEKGSETVDVELEAG